MDPNQNTPQSMQTINNQTVKNSTSSLLETRVFHQMLKIQLRFNQDSSKFQMMLIRIYTNMTIITSLSQ